MPRPKRQRSNTQAAPVEPAAAAEVSSKLPSDTLSDLYADIDHSKITIIEDNSYKGDGRGPPTHLDPVSPPRNALEKRNEQPAGQQPSSPGVEMSRREYTPPRRTIGDMTGLDLDDEMFCAGIGMDSSFEDGGRSHTSASKPYNNFSFTMSNFRRRGQPRASSFVGASNAASTRPGSRGQNTTGVSSTLNLAIFKRRAREPSILGTAQKKKSLRHKGSESSSGASDTAEHDDSGSAEARNEEGSPLCCRGTRVPAGSPSSKSSSIDVSEFQSRKRKFSDAYSHADQLERPLKAPSLVPDHQFNHQDEDILYPSSSVPASPHSPSPVLRTDNQEDDPAILAPPASSGSSEPELPPLQPIARRGRPAASRKSPPPLEFDDESSNIPSPPSLTHSPNYPLLRATKKAPSRQQQNKKNEAPTTAQLAGMLARRRRGRHRDMRREDNEASGNDVDSSSPSDNDSDVSYLDIRPPRKQSATTTTTAAAVKTSSSSSSLNRLPPSRGRGRASKTRSNKVAKGPAQRRKRPRRTYGSNASPSAEKENNEQVAERSDADGGNEQHEYEEGDTLAPFKNDAHFDDEPSELLERRLGIELKMAKRKFQEVDKWDLVFEEVQRSSSPAGAR